MGKSFHWVTINRKIVYYYDPEQKSLIKEDSHAEKHTRVDIVIGDIWFYFTFWKLGRVGYSTIECNSGYDYFNSHLCSWFFFTGVTSTSVSKYCVCICHGRYCSYAFDAGC